MPIAKADTTFFKGERYALIQYLNHVGGFDLPTNTPMKQVRRAIAEYERDSGTRLTRPKLSRFTLEERWRGR